MKAFLERRPHLKATFFDSCKDYSMQNLTAFFVLLLCRLELSVVDYIIFHNRTDVSIALPFSRLSELKVKSTGRGETIAEGLRTEVLSQLRLYCEILESTSLSVKLYNIYRATLSKIIKIKENGASLTRCYLKMTKILP